VARIAVAATAPFGADVLERLAARHDVATLLTRADAPAGRGRRVAAPPAKEVAERLGIPVLQPDRPSAGLELDAPTVVVCAYGLLVPEALLAERAWLNVHPSLLPRWRGAAPVERAIMAGDAETGVTIHETVAELDAGPVAAQEAFVIGPEDDAGALYARAAEVAARLLDGGLDLDRPAGGLVRVVRALSPHIGARAELEGRPVTIWRARVGDDGGFEPLEVQPDGGRRMPVDAWRRGLR
jgi:methionyl-tRNA formyltransferase